MMGADGIGCEVVVEVCEGELGHAGWVFEDSGVDDGVVYVGEVGEGFKVFDEVLI